MKSVLSRARFMAFFFPPEKYTFVRLIENFIFSLFILFISENKITILLNNIFFFKNNFV